MGMFSGAFLVRRKYEQDGLLADKGVKQIGFLVSATTDMLYS